MLFYVKILSGLNPRGQVSVLKLSLGCLRKYVLVKSNWSLTMNYLSRNSILYKFLIFYLDKDKMKIR